MGRRGRHGRRVQEAGWKNAEVDALYRLAGMGVRVPVPHLVHEGVLLMEFVQDEQGNPAPRLNDLHMSADQRASGMRSDLQIVRMLCAGLINGDLSDFNILMDTNGPVIIDLPQAVNAAGNNSAFALLERDINNMRTTFGRAAPELLETEYAREIWNLYEAGKLTPDSTLSGHIPRDDSTPNVRAVLRQIEDERYEAAARERRRLSALVDN